MSARRLALAITFLPALILATACRPGVSPAAAALRSIRVGDDYGNARQRLLNAGWRPVPTRCSETSICFNELPELATNLSDRRTCGMLLAKDEKVRICLDVVPDGALVASIEHPD